MDDDIAALQALLGVVQKQESKNRLNERNCRDLLVKLIEKELVKVMFSLTLPRVKFKHVLYPCALVQLRTTDCEMYHLHLITTLLKDEIVVAGGRLKLNSAFIGP